MHKMVFKKVKKQPLTNVITWPNDITRTGASLHPAYNYGQEMFAYTRLQQQQMIHSLHIGMADVETHWFENIVTEAGMRKNVCQHVYIGRANFKVFDCVLCSCFTFPPCNSIYSEAQHMSPQY